MNTAEMVAALDAEIARLRRKRRELSPEARERIAAAQRARWAARPKLGNQAPAKAKRGRPAKGAKRTEEENAGETTA